MRFTNREGRKDYDFTLPNRMHKNGVAAIIRARNEEDKIAFALGSVYDLFDQIIVVNNASSDRTVDIVKEFKKRFDDTNKIEIHDYPFKLAPCGPEHKNTPEDSLHSIVYITNYAMSFCRVRCVFRYDADMLVCREGRDKFTAFIKKAGANLRCRWLVPGQTLYRRLDGTLITSSNLDEIGGESRLFPFSYHNRFIKHPAFEVLYSPLPRRVYPRVAFFDLKFASADEFSHWSTERMPTARSKLIWKNFSNLIEGKQLGKEYEILPATFLDDQVQYRL
ncbi:MAG: glycosyltransferase [Gammaproteobacteria bacterium]